MAKPAMIFLFCFGLYGQAPQPTFEVASIRPATPLGPQGLRSERKGGPGTSDPGLYTCRNCPVSWVFAEAYGLMPFEYSAPDWLAESRFDFAARIPPGATKESFRSMLQNLLAERFKLEVHRENREMRVYELTVAKNGPKLAESTVAETSAGDPPGKIERDGDGFPVLTPGMTMAIVPGRARIGARNQPMEWFARTMKGQMQGPVIDRTGLKGNYDFQVSWAFEERSAQDVESAAGLLPYLPSLLQAIQSQLGLRLDQKRGQAEVLVVDHIEKLPSEN